MEFLKLGRYVLLGTVVFFSFLVLALSGSVINTFSSEINIVPVHLGLDLAMGVITLAIMVPSLAIDFFRKGAFTSMVIVEIAWTSLLVIFWVAAAGETSAQLAYLPSTCNFSSYSIATGRRVANTAAESLCRQEQAIEAFSWLNFIFLFGWLVTLIVLAATKHSKGNPSVWKSSVTSSDFLAPRGNAPPSLNQSYQTPPPMQQQQTGYSQGYPPSNGYHPNVAQV